MFILITRLLFVILSALCGLWIGIELEKPFDYAFSGFLLSFIIIIFEHNTDIISSKKILFGSVGLLFGLILANFLASTIPPDVMRRETALVICNLLFGYFGIILAIKHENRFNLSRLNFILNPSQEKFKNVKILDTNIIIDGRIMDLLDLDFIVGKIIVPSFVIDELQLISDSTDIQKRARGRRGLDTLNELKEKHSDRVEILEKEYPDIKLVDQKLLQLAKETNSVVLTNDYNLKKVAALKGVKIFNINELANILKPSVFIGEVITIRITREGKESHQGVGYLDDGTMVVVDNGSDRINSVVDVMVNSILQTSSGRMIFASIVQENSFAES